jgi:hypothetical protein
MVVRCEDEDVGAKFGHHAVQALEGVQICGAGGRQYPHCPLEEVRGGSAQSDLL